MKTLLGILAGVIAITSPLAAQTPASAVSGSALRLQPVLFQDQDRDDQYHHDHDRDRDHDHDRDRDRDRDRDHDRDHDRGHDYHHGRGSYARFSASDQQRFDSYYSRWQQYRATNNRDQMISMEKRMNDIYNHYGVPPGTPYQNFASNGGGYYGGDGRFGHGGYGYARLSSSDQSRFDSYYSRWQQYRATNNREQIASMEKRMNDIYSHYGIPLGTPYERIASQGRY
ncbi:MAG TPA: hypothetical protein VMT28_00005 [Terriglobales bacterium]|jgi:hypothetical protein|nr:hypothetical protein [Terriglobales bacterium]